MDAQTKANILGKIFTVLWMAWVYTVDDSIYNVLKQRGNYDKLISKREKETEIYEDTSYAIWRRALGKARIQVLTKRIPSEDNKSQKKLSEYGV